MKTKIASIFFLSIMSTLAAIGQSMIVSNPVNVDYKDGKAAFFQAISKRYIFMASQDRKSIQQYEILDPKSTNGTQLRPLETINIPAERIEVSGDESTLVIQKSAAAIVLYDLKAKKVRKTLEFNAAEQSWDINYDGTLLAMRDADNPAQVNLVDGKLGTIRKSMKAEVEKDGKIMKVKFGHKGNYLAAISGTKLFVWNTGSGLQVHMEEIEPYNPQILGLDMNYNGNIVAIAFKQDNKKGNKTLFGYKAIDLEKGKTISSVMMDASWKSIRDIAVSPGGKMLWVMGEIVSGGKVSKNNSLWAAEKGSQISCYISGGGSSTPLTETYDDPVFHPTNPYMILNVEHMKTGQRGHTKSDMDKVSLFVTKPDVKLGVKLME